MASKRKLRKRIKRCEQLIEQSLRAHDEAEDDYRVILRDLDRVEVEGAMSVDRLKDEIDKLATGQHDRFSAVSRRLDDQATRNAKLAHEVGELFASVWERIAKLQLVNDGVAVLESELGKLTDKVAVHDSELTYCYERFVRVWKRIREMELVNEYNADWDDAIRMNVELDQAAETAARLDAEAEEAEFLSAEYAAGEAAYEEFQNYPHYL